MLSATRFYFNHLFDAFSNHDSLLTIVGSRFIKTSEPLSNLLTWMPLQLKVCLNISIYTAQQENKKKKLPHELNEQTSMSLFWIATAWTAVFQLATSLLTPSDAITVVLSYFLNNHVQRPLWSWKRC